jgi:hypothetical protein
MWFAVAVLAAWLVSRWPRPLIALVVVFSAILLGLVATWYVIGQPMVLTTGQERAARWIEANTPERTVFLTDDWVASPVDLAGRLRVTTFGPYVENLGYDPEQRAFDVRRAYCEGDAAAAEVMRLYGVTYALSPSTPINCEQAEKTAFDGSPLFETVYQAGGVSIWKLRGDGALVYPCARLQLLASRALPAARGP